MEYGFYEDQPCKNCGIIIYWYHPPYQSADHNNPKWIHSQWSNCDKPEPDRGNK